MPSGVLSALTLLLGTIVSLAVLVRMIHKYPPTITIVKKNLDLSAITEKAAGQAYLDEIRENREKR